MSAFLSCEDVETLTGRKAKSKQIDALRKMGVAFWVNAIGKPIVSQAAIEGRKEKAAPKQNIWTPPS